MILVNELRIGNWANLIALDQKIQIESISRNFGMPGLFTWMNEDVEYEDSLTAIEGLPLSSELLMACGFEEDDGEFQHPDNTDFDLMICCSENNLWCAYNFGNEGKSVLGDKIPQATVANPICNPFKYFHQLQNLYFSLTGTELTYQP